MSGKISKTILTKGMRTNGGVVAVKNAPTLTAAGETSAASETERIAPPGPPISPVSPKEIKIDLQRLMDSNGNWLSTGKKTDLELKLSKPGNGMSKFARFAQQVNRTILRNALHRNAAIKTVLGNFFKRSFWSGG